MCPAARRAYNTLIITVASCFSYIRVVATSIAKAERTTVLAATKAATRPPPPTNTGVLAPLAARGAGAGAAVLLATTVGVFNSRRSAPLVKN